MEIMSASSGKYLGKQEEAGGMYILMIQRAAIERGGDGYGLHGGVAMQEARNITPGVRNVVTDQD
jgi:hypothetical protein